MKKRILPFLLALLLVVGFLPTAAYAGYDYITSVNVKDLDWPEAGKAPDRAGTLAGYCQIVNVDWDGSLDSNGHFIEGNIYTVNIIVKIKDTFSKWDKKRFDPAIKGTAPEKFQINTKYACTITELSDYQITMSYTFPAVGTPEPITTKRSVNYIKAVDIDIPTIGAKPDTTATEAQSSELIYYDQVEWEGELDANGCFKAGVAYSVKLTAKVFDHYINATFPSDRFQVGDTQNATVNGEPATVTALSDRQATITFTFPALKNAPTINSITITDFTIPRIGQEPDTTIGVDHDQLEIVKIDFQTKVDENGLFNNLYSANLLYVTLKIKDGSEYAFSPMFKVGEKYDLIQIGDKAAYVDDITDDTILIRGIFYAKEASTIIDKVTIEGLTRPIIGNKPDTEVTIKQKNTIKLESIEWLGDLDFYGEFDYNTAYTARITVSTLYSNIFGPEFNTVGKVNNCIGNAGAKVVSYSETKLVFDIPYTTTDSVVGEAPATMIRSPYVFDGGDGTYENPYLVSTAEQLNAIRFGLSQHYKLTADIDLSGWGNWIPIGSNDAYGGINSGGTNYAIRHISTFTGSLDGNGHVISGMTIKIDAEELYLREQANVRYYGLFMALDAGINNTKIDHIDGTGTRTSDPYTCETYSGVRNLGVVNYTIDVHHSVIDKPYWIYAGAIAGSTHGVDITNCYSSGGTMRFDLRDAPVEVDMDIYVGGLVGTASWTDFRYCYNDSDVTVLADPAGGQNNYIQMGGIAAVTTSAWFISCYNSGDITAPQYDGTGKDLILADAGVASGIVSTAYAPVFPGVLYHTGEELNTYIWNCYNTGTLTGEFVCGIMYYGSSDYYIDNCYNIGKLNGSDPGSPEELATEWPVTTNYTDVWKFGTEYIRRLYTNGNSVQNVAGGEGQWTKSEKLGRMVLTKIHEENAGPMVYSGTISITLDGKKVKLDAYAQRDSKGNSTNYVKMRDIAYLLNGTAAQFNLGWSGSVNIEKGKTYQANGTEMSTPFSGNRSYKLFSGNTKVNGVIASLAAITLTDDNGGGYTYYQLKDLGKVLNFDVHWDSKLGIVLNTDQPYK